MTVATRATLATPDAIPAPRDTAAPFVTRGDGVEWVVEAFDADPARLASIDTLRALVAEVVDTLGLTAIGTPLWHQFPPPSGITGLVLLAESHLALHTFPEHGSLCVNLFCCVPRPEWPWEDGLRRHVGAGRTEVRRIARAYGGVVGHPRGSDQSVER